MMTPSAPSLHHSPTVAELDSACTSSKEHWLSLLEQRNWQADPEEWRKMVRARLAYHDAVAAWFTAGGHPILHGERLTPPADLFGTETSMSFSVTFVGLSADEQVKDWMAHHCNGFYLYSQEGNGCTLHTADCWLLGDSTGVNGGSYGIVCSDSIRELEKWAKVNRATLIDCPDCKPRLE
jgi:hypothetical protein